MNIVPKHVKIFNFYCCETLEIEDIKKIRSIRKSMIFDTSKLTVLTVFFISQKSLIFEDFERFHGFRF